MPAFHIRQPTALQVPIVVSVPHCGTAFPEELVSHFDPKLIAAPDDTDWFVHELYDFVSDLGIDMIHAHYSRWVIDLNRDPQSKPLYTDGRIITDLCPSTTFLGEPLFVDRRGEVTADEIQRRVQNYYLPYHQQLQQLLAATKEKFGQVLLWDCHSIRQHVPTIRQDKFPDLILGNADGISASPGLIEAALSSLEHSEYSVSHNHPFKGGYITRAYGRPAEHVHALQLEMTKVNYMDDSEQAYDRARAEKMRTLLKQTFERLIEMLR
ncbi:MAG: N-formylglutamate amidohydrolase [Cyclobacteriaceae bacterium]